MDEQQKKHARWMSWARFVLRAATVLGLLIVAGCWGVCCLKPSLPLQQPPVVTVRVVEELPATESDAKPGAVPLLRKRVTTTESSWVQFAHSAMVWGINASVLGVLVWGIVSVAKQED